MQNIEEVINGINFVVSGMLLPELIVSLILLEQEVSMFLTSINWLDIFSDVLKSLDKLVRLSPDIEVFDLDDIAWQGITQARPMNVSLKLHDDLPLIRKADLENHNLDGGRWVVINNRVYDVQDFRCDNTAMTELLEKYAGKDASHIFNSCPQNHQLLTLMENYIVGNYCQPETDLQQSNLDSLTVCATLLDAERNLGYLLGLHSFNLRQSLPLTQEEIASSRWLKSPFLSGGLQVFR